MNDEDWAFFYIILAMLAMVAICTASVAYWAHSASGLWSLLIFTLISGHVGETSRKIALLKAERGD